MLKPVFLALALASMPLPTAIASDHDTQRQMSLSGRGEVRVAPDLAVLTMGVMTNGENAAAAMDANSKVMVTLLETLKTAGIEARDIQTSSLMLNPRYGDTSSNSAPQAAGFDANNNVTITVRNLSELGKVIDLAVTSGANQVNGLIFGLKNDQQAIDDARKLAVEEAQRKAALYADATGVTLGNVLSIMEGTSFEPMQGRMFMERAKSANDVPIAAGEQVLAVDVTMTWEIK
jgi:uncharacterized protein